MQCALLGYCMHFGDIYRILNGYDNCGNVCGRDNVFEIKNSGCHGINMTSHRYLRVQSWGIDTFDSNIQTNRICVESCSNYSELYVLEYGILNENRYTIFVRIEIQITN